MTYAAPSAAPDSSAPAGVLHLRRGGTSVVIDLATDGPPAIVHWGEELRSSTPQSLESLAVAARPQRVSGGLDATGRLGVLATASDGWFGTPAIEAHRAGSGFAMRFQLDEVHATPSSASLELSDRESHLFATLELEVGSAGLFRQRLTVRNAHTMPLTLNSAMMSFPVPWDAAEILDTTGRHLRERSPQRRAFTIGTHLRESRRGRPGADATLLLAAGRTGFGFERGRVHGIHLAWSGSHRVIAERGVTGEAFLAGGELLGAGEVILGADEAYVSPWAIGSWGDGLDELAHRFHDEWRARPQHPRSPRPITLNTWEAVYFDHSLPKLERLATVAAELGVERFVLDDGWFSGRRDDTAGLGDWFVDPDVWPTGLHPLVDHVRALGMEFGLWVEPEMVNPASELARRHPDWILRGRTELPPSARQQQVIDLSRPDAFAHIAERLIALLDEYPISYLKWDHNRDLVDAGSGAGGASRVHAHTLAVYRLIDLLKAHQPGLEIESCASGGARVDLGILDRTDRIWVSDCLDPLERLGNQRYTALVVPPEMMGMHLTSPVVHSTHRTVDLDLSGAVALFGHVGAEWDLTAIDDAQSVRVAEWIALAKRLRPLVATGRVVNVDGVEPGIDVRGVVAPDQEHAVYTIVQTATTAAYPPGRVRLPGLAAARLYAVRVLSGPGAGSGTGSGSGDQEPGQSPLAWTRYETVLTGAELDAVGLRPPVQFPERATVVEVTALPG